MKILFYCDPWFDISDKPKFQLLFLNSFLDYNVRNLCGYGSLVVGDNVEAKAICSDIILSTGLKDKYNFIEFIAIEQRELKSIFDSFREYSETQYKMEYGSKLSALNDIIRSKLGDFNPDIIIPTSSTARGLKYLYPNTPILFNENGIFARAPYPTSLYFDCSSGMDESFLLRYKKEIQSFEIGDKEKNFLSEIRNFFDGHLKPFNRFEQIVANLRKKFSILTLLPLQVFHSPMFVTQGGCAFKDQIDYLEYVLNAVGEDVGVIVTEHSLDKILVYEPIVTYFRSKYTNFVYLSASGIYPNSSQFLLRLVDGVITVSSTVGLQALLYQKPLFIASKTSYLNAFSDGSDLSDVGNFIKEKRYKDKDGALYYLLTRYYVLGRYYENSKWFYNFLKRSIKKFSDGVDFNFYDKIDEEEELLKGDYILISPKIS